MSALRGRTVLAIFAHPDDESLACGGTLARLAEAGARPWLLCATHGERAGARRSRELIAAARTLGLAGVIQLDFPDGTLRWAHVTEFQAHILLAVARLDPVALITFDEDGLYWHPDHIGVHERTLTAWRLLGPAAPALYFASIAAGVVRRITDHAAARGWRPPAAGPWSISPDAFGLAAPAATHTIEAGGVLERKLQALRDHATQMTAGPLGHLDAAAARELLGPERLRRHGPAPADPLRDIT